MASVKEALETLKDALGGRKPTCKDIADATGMDLEYVKNLFGGDLAERPDDSDVQPEKKRGRKPKASQTAVNEPEAKAKGKAKAKPKAEPKPKAASKRAAEPAVPADHEVVALEPLMKSQKVLKKETPTAVEVPEAGFPDLYLCSFLCVFLQAAAPQPSQKPEMEKQLQGPFGLANLMWLK